MLSWNLNYIQSDNVLHETIVCNMHVMHSKLTPEMECCSAKPQVMRLKYMYLDL